MTQIKSIFLLILLLFISACGYQLRGSIDVPEGLKSIFMQGASGSLSKAMGRTLKFSGGQLVDSVGQAGLVVQIDKENMNRRVQSLSSTGRASEYELIYKLEFILLDKAGNVLSEKQKIEINKIYFNDQKAILGKSNEEQVIRNEMYREAVQSIINRSRVILEKLEK